MWAWGNDSGGWNPMPDATSATLEQAFQALPHDANAPARVTYDVDQGDRVANYELDFRKMKQTNLATSFKRAVRRFQAPAGAQQAGQPPRIWAWEMDDGGYWPCDADHSEFLSLVQARGWRAARYWTDSHTQYEASLLPQGGIMTQRNRETGRVRGLAVDVALGGAGGQPASVPQMVDALLARCRDVTAALAAQAQQQQQRGGGDDEADQDVCLICHEGFTARPALELPDCHGHAFHRDCLKAWLVRSLTCPGCTKSYGPRIGNMPTGQMTVAKFARSRMSLPGYEVYGAIMITYSLPSGVQGPEHQHPGQRYWGTTRTAYLPDSPEGRELLALLQRAWQQKLTFTIGRSITTGRDNTVVWNGIHHKTATSGGPQAYGYPDPTYLARLRDELRVKGIE